MEAMMRAESGCTGRADISWFQGLSGGKTWSADRMASASGVSNITGRVIFGSGGRSGPAATARSKAVAAPRPGRRDLDAPGARHHRPPIRRREPGQVFPPEGLPHLLEVGIVRQGPSLRRVERPVLAGAPRATTLVSGRPELPARTAAR